VAIIAVPQAVLVEQAVVVLAVVVLQTEHPGPQILAAVVAGHQTAVLA
jgi:hypothetical protein